MRKSIQIDQDENSNNNNTNNDLNNTKEKKKKSMSLFFKKKSISSPNMNNFIIQQQQAQQPQRQQSLSTPQILQTSPPLNNCESNSSSNNNNQVTVKVGNTSNFLKKSVNMAPLSSSAIITSLVQDNGSTTNSSSNTCSPTSQSDDEEDEEEEEEEEVGSEEESQSEEESVEEENTVNSPLSSSPHSEPEELLTKRSRKSIKSKELPVKEQQPVKQPEQSSSSSSSSTTITNSSDLSSNGSGISTGNNNNNNNNIQLNSSTSSTVSSNSYKSTNFSIISKPSTESSWIVPTDFDIEKCKQSAAKDIEFILSTLSANQKTLNSIVTPPSPPTTPPNDNTVNNNNNNNNNEEIERFEKKCKARHDILVILEMLKQFNFGYDMIDFDFDSLSVVDEMERKTFLLAKKILFLKMELNKPLISTKRTYILYSIISSISKFQSTNIIPTEIISMPLEMTITMCLTNGLLPHINNQIYKKGYLTTKKSRTLGSKFSSKWVILSHGEILIYSNDREEQCLIKKPLHEIISIVITPLTKDGYPNCFTVYFSNNDTNEITEEWNQSFTHLEPLIQSSSPSNSNLNNNGSSANGSSNGTGNIKRSTNKSIIFCCDNLEDMVSWVIAFDGVSNSNFKSSMDLIQKEQYLQLNKTNYKGGSFRYQEEEWIYCDGKLTTSSWENGKSLQYHWDGCTLTPAESSEISLGRGRWNGCWLTWYGGAQDKVKEPFLKYLYQPSQKQFILDNYPFRTQYSWTLSRHFLVSSSGGGGEWIIEGDVPPVLVMLVQMMKYYKVGK